MAATRWKLYNAAKLGIGNGLIDLDSHTFKCSLYTASSNANTLTNTVLANLTNEVANGNGYTTGGVTLTGVTWTNSSGTITFDCADPSWTASGAGFTARYAVIYDLSAAGQALLCVCALDSVNVTVVAGNELQIMIDASGVFTLSGANTD